MNRQLLFAYNIGDYNYILPKLTELYSPPSSVLRKDNSIRLFEYIEYINTVIPDGIYLNISYDRYTQGLNKGKLNGNSIQFHLDLSTEEMENDEGSSDVLNMVLEAYYDPDEMVNKKIEYRKLLKKLDIQFRDPSFYIIQCVYN